jgi:septal ring factor EnvC (AmiA/AmiB activator)
MVASELQSHDIDVLPPLPPPQAGAPWAWLALPLLLVLVLAVALARRRRWSGLLRALQRNLWADRILPRQAGHRLARLLRQMSVSRPDALAALRSELDALRFARDEPAAERVADLIARTRQLARRPTDGR